MNARQFAVVGMLFLLTQAGFGQMWISHSAPGVSVVNEMATQGINIEITIPIDSLKTWDLSLDAIRDAAGDGVGSTGWKVNGNSPFLVAIDISYITMPNGGMMFHLQSNGGYNTTAAELIGVMRSDPTVDKTWIIDGRNFQPLLPVIRQLAAKASSKLFRDLERKAMDRKSHENLQNPNDF